MCELFGVNTSGKIQLNDLLSVFFSHGVRHPHGWGMAFFEKNTVRIEKQAVEAEKSAKLKEYLSSPIYADHMIAHIRLATKGNMEYENCHPFVRKDSSGRVWTLAHNGTIFEGKATDPYFYKKEGQTDSERILYFLTDRINKYQGKNAHSPDAETRFYLLDEIIREIAPENKLNLLICDGEYFYVHTNCNNGLHVTERNGGFVFSTVPLDGGEWKPLPVNTLLAYKGGKLVKRGTDHGFTYVEDPEKMKMLFLDYSRL